VGLKKKGGRVESEELFKGSNDEDGNETTFTMKGRVGRQLRKRGYAPFDTSGMGVKE